MIRKKVVVIGAGPGGLTASMLLASRGYSVQVFEANDRVGGRNQAFQLDGGYSFDAGPTFLMMKFILEEVFALAGRNLQDYLDVKSIDPLYRLVFADGRVLLPTHDPRKMEEELERFSPGSWASYQSFLKKERTKFDRLAPCLQVPYDSPAAYLRPRFLKALPLLDAHTSLFDVLGRYFTDETLELAFTFQAKYLGMSPWKCPGTFSIIPFIEHDGGIHHPIGGLNKISEAMAKVLQEEKGELHLSSPVQEVLVRDRCAVGVKLASGEEVLADHVVINADFGHAMNHLVKPQHLERWSPAKLETKGLSCSTYMLYLGVDKVYDQPHHSVLFAGDYRQNVREIAETMVLSEDPSVYVQNASITDATLAPPGHSTLYVLVPVPNTRSGIDWDAVGPAFRDKVLALTETRGGFPDLRAHIVAEKVVTPKDWEQTHRVYRGATFNLAHTLDQMLYFRPHNAFEELDNCFIVGGGTHPGSGLPTIYESGRISAGLVLRKDAWI